MLLSILIVVGVAVAAGALSIIMDKRLGYSGDYGAAFCFGFMAGFATVFILAGVVASMREHVELEPRQRSEEVIAFQDTTELRGSVSSSMFVLVGSLSGNVSESPVYLFYSKDDKGGIRQRTLDVDDAVVYETADKTPEYITYSCPNSHYEQPDWSLKSIEYGCDDDELPEDEIHVPPGTVVRDFRMDLE